MNEVRAACAVIEREWTRASEMLSGLPDSAWSTATRCEGWSVADLVAHTCWGTSFEADGLRRARTSADGVAEGDDVRADETPEGLRLRLAANAAALVEEVDEFLDAPHDRPVPMPYGELPVPLALDVFAMEAGLHASDLAAALGDDDRLEADVCRAALAFLRAFGPTLADQGGARLDPGQSVALRVGDTTMRFVHDGEAWRADDLVATATISGGDSDVILFALGRRPLDAVTIEGDREVARRFKEVVPGP